MTQFLPPNLLALFAPRDPIPYLPPLDKLPHEKKQVPYSGVSQLLGEFEDPKDTPPPTRVETREERKERKRKERAEQHAYKLEQDLALWDPHNNPVMTSDPYKTLFVARINYDTSESKLRREFEVYGPVRRIKLLANTNNNKPRGYAFIEYEHERDMHSAYKHADGKKIDGRRVLVDVERARTVKGWRPRRLGGGLGGTRKGGPDVNTKYSGRDDNFGAGLRDEREDHERSRSREREPRPERRRRRSRSGSPVEQRRRRGSRSKSRERRRKRSRSRERRRSKERRRSGSRERVERKRSRSRERKRRRSRSKERARRSRSRERRPEEGPEPGPQFNQEQEFPEIKQEPEFDEARYGHGGEYQPNGEENYQEYENYDNANNYGNQKMVAGSQDYGEYGEGETQ